MKPPCTTKKEMARCLDGAPSRMILIMVQDNNVIHYLRTESRATETSRRRLREAAHRGVVAAADMDGLCILSKEDHQDMPPLKPLFSDPRLVASPAWPRHVA
jgi:hypothetical protein